MITIHLKTNNMGFIQKLATKSERIKKNPNPKYSKNCECEYYYKVRIPKLTWKYVLNLKNWK